MNKNLPPALKTALGALTLSVLVVFTPAALARRVQQSKMRASESKVDVNQKQVRQLGKKTSDPMYLDMRMEQVNEDFEHLKAANNELLKMLKSRDEISYNRVSELSKEIKERGSHLREVLALPVPVEEKESRKEESKGPSAEQMKPWLRGLTDLVFSFVTNPVFKSEKEIDPNLAAQARRDLEELIALSEKIRKSAERLEKERAR